jgi:hypothetical protein
MLMQRSRKDLIFNYSFGLFCVIHFKLYLMKRSNLMSNISRYDQCLPVCITGTSTAITKVKASGLTSKNLTSLFAKEKHSSLIFL